MCASTWCARHPGDRDPGGRAPRGARHPDGGRRGHARGRPRLLEWSQPLTSEDYRGLTPLTWAHVAVHGEFKLNMNSRLDLGHTSP
jgi:hypothetical protein